MLKQLLVTLLASVAIEAGAKGALYIDLSEEGPVTITPEKVTFGNGSESSMTGYPEVRLTSTGETTNSVKIEGGTESNPLRITLDKLNINRESITEDGTAMTVKSGYVDISLSGESTLKSGFHAAGLNIPDGATVKISDFYIGDGVLRCYGGSEKIGNRGGGAGIGANYSGSCGTLILESGKIYAQGCYGGAGFGSAWAWQTDGNLAGGTFIQNGGEAHFEGSANFNIADGTSCPEGVGSVNGSTTLKLNGGSFEASIRTNTAVTVKGATATYGGAFSGLTPGAEYTLFHYLGMEEATVKANSYGDMGYWLTSNQQSSELIGNRYKVTAQASKSYQGIIEGAGFYYDGDVVELKYVPKEYSLYGFDSWSNGSTENPTTVTVTGDMEITANISPRVEKMWRVNPVDGSETECYVYRFDGMDFPGGPLEIPETFVIDGKTYTTAYLGHQRGGSFDVSTMAEIPELILPSGLQKVSPESFGHIWGLKTVTINAVTPPVLMEDAEEFIYVPNDCVLKVPKGSADDYANAPGWKAFAGRIEEMPATTVTLDLAANSLSITADGYTVGDIFEPFTGKYVITTSAATTNSLTVEGGSEETPLRITLDGVDIDNSSCTEATPAGGAVIVSSGYVNLDLKGESTLRGGVGMPGLNIPDGATVVIDGDGVLRSYGGGNGYDIGGAGIGARAGNSCGKLVVNGGTVYGYGIDGGAGFGISCNRWQNGYLPGGVFVINGGEATFEGSTSVENTNNHVEYGIGSSNGATSVEINGGTLHTSFYRSCNISYKGQPATRNKLQGMTLGETYVLYNMLGMAEYSAKPYDQTDEVFLNYWLIPGQTLKDLVGDRIIVQAIPQYFYSNGKVYGGGLYDKGTVVTFTYKRPVYNVTNVMDFDHWDNGSTENPITLKVEEDMTLIAYLEPRVEHMWRAKPSEGSDNNCYVYEFMGDRFTGSVLEVPASFEIDGKTYTTTTFGDNTQGYMRYDLRTTVTELILPETITGVGASSLYIWEDHHMDSESSSVTITCHATTPPAIVGGEDFFIDESKSYTLKVPKGSADAYKAAPGWKKFNLEEFDVTGIGVGTVDDTSSHAPVYYDLRGLRVGSDKSSLAPGLYIERRGASAKRVIVSR